MNYSSKFNSILPQLVQEASKSPIKYNLAAGILKGGTLVKSPTHNTNGNLVRGCVCSSLHAEHRAMLQNFPNLKYSRSKGWCFLRAKGKGAKFKKAFKEPSKG